MHGLCPCPENVHKDLINVEILIAKERGKSFQLINICFINNKRTDGHLDGRIFASNLSIANIHIDGRQTRSIFDRSF